MALAKAITLCGVGIAGASVVANLSSALTPLRVVEMLAILCLLLLAGWVGQAKNTLLFGWVFLMPNSRVYYLLDPANLDGFQALYVTRADVVFFVLLGIWAYELVILKKPVEPRGPSLALFYLPFLAACLLSVFSAERPDWAFNEFLRHAKLALMLYYLRHHLGRTQIYVVVAAFAASVMMEGALSVLQVTTERFQSEVLAGESYRRGKGSFLHPNTLAGYLILLTPLFTALALTIRSFPLRLISAGCALAGFAGLAATLSRTGWAIGAAQAAILLLALPAFRLISARLAISLVVLAGVAVGPVVPRVAEKLSDRFRENFREGADFRADYNAASMKIFRTQPLTGVGLNNFEIHQRRVAPALIGSDDELTEPMLEQSRLRLIRSIIVVHNLYLLILAETGILGIAGFAFFALAVVVKFARRIFLVEGFWSAGALAGVVGVAGVLAQGLMEYSFWLDGVLVPFMVLAGAVNCLPGAFAPDGVSIPRYGTAPAAGRQPELGMVH